MKFTTTLFAAGAVIVSVYSAPVRRAVDPNLVPDFGITAGTNPTGTGDCDGTTGADGKPILVPCACPPERNSFIDHLSADVAAGHAVNNPSVAISFPTDDSVQSEIARITAVLISLQNLNGPGVGCPAASTDLLKKQQALQAGTATTDAAPAAPVSNADSSSDAAAATGVDPSLVPDFGIEAGVNPTGTGDCDGTTGPDGKPIAVPCSCPPERNSFIQHLSADVANGFAVNNPDVAINFPTDDSVESQIARIGAVVISLQNLNGPGVGCPAASTTLLAQSKALQDGTATAPAAPASTSDPATAPADASNGAAADTAPATGGVDPALVPDFGITANTNPSGTGDCDGTIGPDGKPILIPCACPPERNSFIEHLSADVAAGHAVNNPDVAISFPTDDSVQGQIGRITAVLISLQNLNGPGKGCPAASTTLLATQKALQAQL